MHIWYDKKTWGFPSQFIKSTNQGVNGHATRAPPGVHTPEQVSNQEPPDSRPCIYMISWVSYVWYMMLYMMYQYNIINTFHMKHDLKSFMISCTYDIIHDLICIWYHISGIWYSIRYIVVMSYTHFIWNITWSHIWCHVFKMSNVMSYVYDVMYDVMCIWYHMFGVWCPIWYPHWFSPVQNADLSVSNVAPGQLKCNPIWIKCRPCSSPTSVCLYWHQSRVAVVYHSILGISPNALASPPHLSPWKIPWVTSL